MCRCKTLIISVVFCAICCTNIVLPSPNAWPKMRNYDIWETVKSPKHERSEDIDSYTIDNSANVTGSRDSRVLNFFPVPVDDECLSDDGRRSGVCLNVYECRIQGGSSRGQCALGFGVCCVFTATCEQEVFNNITYIVSPSFPALMSNDVKSCKLKIKMISPDISQLRLDFVHFSIGQPNRRTGICDGDIFSLTGGVGGDFMLCGQNNGQHSYSMDDGAAVNVRIYSYSDLIYIEMNNVKLNTPPASPHNATAIVTIAIGECVYYDVPVANTMGRQGRQEVSDIELFMNFTDRFASTRLWEIRVAQIPFSQRAPSGCLQYFTSPTGIIQTFNFAENGRHLANQNYRACVRQETGMCSISYEPCTEQSFRIGQRNPANVDSMQDAQSVNMDPIGSDVTSMMTAQAPATANQQQTAPISETPVQDAAPAEPVQDQEVSADTAEDVVEGSGGGDIPAVAPVRTGFFSSFFSRRAFSYRQSRQYFSNCNDRITMPCIVEDFIAAGMGNVPDCTPIHCGDSLCAPGVLPCRVESTVTPFGLGIRFGDGLDKGSPEDNIGACLRFSQVNCA